MIWMVGVVIVRFYRYSHCITKYERGMFSLSLVDSVLAVCEICTLNIL